MNAYSEISAVNCAHHNTAQGCVLIPDDKRAPPADVETHMGPWGWQWRDGVHDIVLASPSSPRITIKALMDGIEKDAPGMYRTVTDLAYSRSSECPFIIDELSMADLRGWLHKYENEKILLPRDAQVGMRKSIAAALGKKKGRTPEGKIHAVAYPYSTDAERTADGLWGLRQPFTDEIGSGSGTMSMDLCTEDGSPSIPPELPTSSKTTGPRVCVGVTGSGRVDSSPGRKL